MAGHSTPDMAVAVAEAGGLGALACASLSAEQAAAALEDIRGRTSRPINLNFFCHTPPTDDPARMMRWRARLAPFYVEHGVDPAPAPPASNRAPFDEAFCQLVEAQRPEVVSFHFGLPAPDLLARVKATGAKVLSSATTVAEARWLAARGCDAIIAMGYEAGGHRGNFLDRQDDVRDMARQPGVMALTPQIVDAVDIPVIAAGGIADGRGVAAAFALGAAGVQVGTAYLFSPEAKLAPGHREALDAATDASTAVTNLFTGRPARGLVNRIMRESDLLSEDTPAFPTAGGALIPLKEATKGSQAQADFANLWSGQAAALAPRLPAGELTRRLAEDALTRLARL